MSHHSTDAMVYVGTYTQVMPHVHGKAEGIYICRLDGATGALERLDAAPGVVNPSFLTVSADGRFLYAVQEVEQYDDHPGGAVSAFAIDARTHALVPINHQHTHGAHPCYVSIDLSGRWLLVANYSGPTVSVLPIGADGALGPAATVVRHHGASPHHGGPHPHAIVPAPGGRFVLVPDCGLNRVFVYRLDRLRGELAESEAPLAELPPASGPRHVAFHPGGSYVYSVNEQGSSVTAFAYDAERGGLRALQTLPAVPEGVTAHTSGADIHVHPSGRFVYCSIRGHDSIAAFAVDVASGTLRPLGHTPTGGRTPRNFAIDPRGAFLLAANQDSDTVVTFRIDQDTGALEETGQVAHIPSPVCLYVVE
ncbi:MAG TPA: lactonase family protein [Roseiflexaceae bacterium]|nr:lactonase family protein [Roseiflexaceae bacterium]